MTDHRTIAVLGSGFAGFGAGHRLETAGRPYVCFDKNPYIGGHTASHVQPDGWVFDDGPHVSFTKDERVQGILADAVDGRFESVPIRLNNYWQGYWFTHPAQVNLHGLPTDLIVRLLVDFVEAQRIADPQVSNYEEWCLAAFGRTFAETFPLVYGRKYHTTEAANLTTDWLGPRMYRPNLAEIFQGALASTPTTDVHYVTHFRYPSHGGYVSYVRSWAERAGVRLGHELVGLDPVACVLRFATGLSVPYRQVISSIGLPELIPMIDGVPGEVREAAARLAFTSVVMVNLGIDRADLTDAHVSYFYDEDIVFSRLSFPHRLSPHTVPPGTGSIQAEIYFSDKYRPLPESPDGLIRRVIADLRRCGILRDADQILFSEARVARYGNVIYDHDRAAALATVHGYLDEIGVLYCGRYGEWNHLWTDEAFVSGERAAERALERDG
ncbi:MAG: NAD(P)-binding protein [Chloroflexi bacterium]|nr:NAD(P)-binding protein [Chloroflexota bacterium]